MRPPDTSAITDTPAVTAPVAARRPVAPLRVRDLLVVLVIGVVQVGGTLAGGHAHSAQHVGAAGVVLLVLGPLLLLARRRYPAASLVAIHTVTLAYILLGYPYGPIFFALIAALFTAMTAGRRLVSYLVLVLGYGGMVWLAPLVRGGDGPSAPVALGVAAWLLVLAAGCEVIRVRRAYTAAARQRAAEAARAREQEERRQAGEERLRIARELHDVLAHHISLMNVQASVGLELMDGNPEQARTALAAVKTASAEALGELRAVLRILKGDGEAPPRAPTAGLDGLDRLVEAAAAGGLRVGVEVSGPRRPLPAPVDLAAYRIVQEALTNVIRHAGAGTAVVRLEYSPAWLTVAVTDDGRGPLPAPGGEDARPPAGNGLPGMRERAAALGGRLAAGAAAGGGFRVEALLPVGQEGGPAAAPRGEHEEQEADAS